jgi:nucleoside-diphosphate-sugar epimerase
LRILVTGANGFLGSALVERLLAHGEKDVRCFVRTGSNLSRLRDVEARAGVTLDIFQGSLGSVAAASQALEGIDVVYHVAAGMKGAPADLFINTVVASKNLLEAIVQSGRRPKVILVSSFGVYGVAGLRRGAVLDESTPLESQPQRRDVYSYAKLRQEQLFWDYHHKHGIPLVVLRPGVIYGPGGPVMSSRVGLSLFGWFLHLGGRNRIPLTYVENCAEAIVVAGSEDSAVGQAYNVHDDELPTSREYLNSYRRRVKRMRSITLPYPVTQWLSRRVERYFARSKGQLPAVFTPYKTATSWKGTRFTNAKLKKLGWKPIVTTREGLERAFAYMRANPGS